MNRDTNWTRVKALRAGPTTAVRVELRSPDRDPNYFDYQQASREGYHEYVVQKVRALSAVVFAEDPVVVVHVGPVWRRLRLHRLVQVKWDYRWRRRHPCPSRRSVEAVATIGYDDLPRLDALSLAVSQQDFGGPAFGRLLLLGRNTNRFILLYDDRGAFVGSQGTDGPPELPDELHACVIERDISWLPIGQAAQRA